MSDGLADRLARRREQERHRQVKRRRTALGLVAVLAVGIGAFLLLRGGSDGPAGSDSGKTSLASTDGGKQGAVEPAGAQPDESWKPYEGPVPVLMYHVIGEPAGEVTYPDLYLSVADFKDQVNWLDENGYTPVTLIQVQDAWYDGATLPKKPIVLSFDDGYLGQYLDAMPILRKKGWAGQLNLKAEGSDLSTTEVKKMIKAGWEIASHTIDHPDLTTLDAASLEEEVAGSKKQMEKELGVDIVNFCYPAGQYNDTVIAAVEDAGYRGATTVNPGLARKDMPFELERIRIDQGDGAETLAGYLDSY